MKLLLMPRELLDLGNNLNSVHIECDDGCCWITQAGDSRDHILKAGEIFQVRSGGQLIITALEPCRLLIRAPRRKTAYPGLFKGQADAVYIAS